MISIGINARDGGSIYLPISCLRVGMKRNVSKGHVDTYIFYYMIQVLYKARQGALH